MDSMERGAIFESAAGGSETDNTGHLSDLYITIIIK